MILVENDNFDVNFNQLNIFLASSIKKSDDELQWTSCYKDWENNEDDTESWDIVSLLHSFSKL